MGKEINEIVVIDGMDYKVSTRVIKDLSERYLKMVVTDKESYDKVSQGLRTVINLRVQVTEKRKEFKRTLDVESKRIIDLLTPIEDHLRSEKKIEDDRKEAIREAKRAVERKRVDKIKGKLDTLRDLAMGANSLDQAQLITLKGEISSVIISGWAGLENEYEEFTAEARDVLRSVFGIVSGALEARIKIDKEDRLRKEEAKRQEETQAEQKAEAERLEAQVKVIREARERVKQKQKEFDDEKVKFAAEKQAEVDRVAQEERDEQLAEAAKVKAEKEAKDLKFAQAQEAERQEALRPDKDKLTNYGYKLQSVECPELRDKVAIKFLVTTRFNLSQIVKELYDWTGKGEKS